MSTARLVWNCLFCTLGVVHSITYANLTSSDLSCGTPITIDTTTTITLDTDVSITDVCELIIAGPTFGISQIDSVIFNSVTGGKLVIASGGMWDPVTFDTDTKRIQFLGNAILAINNLGILKLSGPLDVIGAQLALYQGAIILLNNGTITDSGSIATISAGQ